jgi:carbamoyl-phosphate synthase small subunit
MREESSYLILETGDVYTGVGYGAKNNSTGELVFNTSMTGYQEVITDPSYKGQIIIFTYPHIGNIGTCKEDKESDQTWLKAIITREIPTKSSNWRSEKDFNDYLIENNLPGLAKIDTRKLTKIIRDKGNLLGMIVRDNTDHKEALLQILKYKSSDVESKSLFFSKDRRYQIDKNQKTIEDSKLHIAILDLGCKSSILNIFKEYNCKISVLNTRCSIDILKQLKADAILVSNGPGNPELYVRAINLIKEIIREQIPILGICLGHQLLGIALGAKIEKLQFGHHGINHPVKDLDNGKVFITSQNHNYVISRELLPSSLYITHTSLFDQSIQGFMHKKEIFLGFQGHPEGSPGPVDIQKNIVEKFLTEIHIRKNK